VSGTSTRRLEFLVGKARQRSTSLGFCAKIDGEEQADVCKRSHVRFHGIHQEDFSRMDKLRRLFMQGPPRMLLRK
jgi:hypothetical protein